MALVLLIEDDSEISSCVSAALIERGHEVSCLADARNAVEAIRTRPFNLLITDIVMPDRDGIELLSELRASGIFLPVLAMSGAVESSLYLRVARQLGATEVLFKPFLPRELVAAVDRLLKQAPAPC